MYRTQYKRNKSINIKIKDIKESFLNLIVVENTRKTNELWLNKFIMKLPKNEKTLVSEINIEQINNCLREWWNCYPNANTYNLGRQIVLGFIRWGIEEGYFSFVIRRKNILKRKEVGGGTRIPYTDKEINQLIEVLRNSNDTKQELILSLLLIVAPRASEIANLKWDDVKSNRYIYFKRKGGKVVALPVCEYIYNLFKKYFIEQFEPDETEYIFANEKNEKPTRFDIYNEMKIFFEKAGVNYKGVHLFRHKLAITFDRLNVQNSLTLWNFGWGDERMKKVYALNKDEDILRGIQEEVLDLHKL